MGGDDSGMKDGDSITVKIILAIIVAALIVKVVRAIIDFLQHSSIETVRENELLCESVTNCGITTLMVILVCIFIVILSYEFLLD